MCHLYAAVGVFTQERMKNFRSLEAYHFFQSGWVQTVYHHKTTTGNFVFKAAVRPSWRVTEEPHHCWVAVNDSGSVLAGHCDCMAGLGESCSHVAAVLFKLEAAVRLGYTSNVSTDVLCQWNQRFVSNIEPSTISNIKFYKEEAKEKYRCGTFLAVQSVQQSDGGELDDNQQQFLASLDTLQHKPVILSTFAQHCAGFADSTKVSTVKLPTPLPDLYRPEYSTLSPSDFSSLLTTTADSFSVTPDQVDYVDSVTVGQSASPAWYKQRAGRITASVAHAVLRAADADQLPPSLLTQICSSEPKTINVPSVQWGRSHESLAIKLYTALLTGMALPAGVSFPGNIVINSPAPHANCSVHAAGFRICLTKPFLGASPDSYIMCDCHGKGVVEVKCPYTNRDTALSELLPRTDFVVDENYSIRSSHQYSTQMQLQMYVCDVHYCDLVIWQPQSLLIVRVLRDDKLIQTMLPKLCDAWRKHILPFLLRHGNVAAPTAVDVLPSSSASAPIAGNVPSSSAASSSATYAYCICKQDIGGRMIGCDNSNCVYKWFHLQCLQMKRVPRKSPWFCKYCVPGKVPQTRKKSS